MAIKLPPLLALATVIAFMQGCQAPQAPAGIAAMTDSELLARGDYLVRIAGCNDCHTPGYMDQQGNVDKALWLTGNRLGFHGPWGTTYPSNLRLRMTEMDEAQWLAYSADLHTRPMMPDFAVRAMHEDDRRAIYRFARSLGAAGEPAPAYLPPGRPPPLPYVQLVLPTPPPEVAAPVPPSAAN